MIGRFFAHAAFRFVLVGAVNTLLSYALYVWLLQHFTYLIAYGISYVAGIGCSIVLHARYVFGARISTRVVLLYPLMYLGQYLLGLAILKISVDIFSVAPEYALAICIVLTIPPVFFISRWIMQCEQPDTSKPASSSPGA